MTPATVYEHEIGEVPLAAGPLALAEAMDAASQHGLECFGVLIQNKRTEAGPAPHYVLLLRKPKVNLVLPNGFLGRDRS